MWRHSLSIVLLIVLAGVARGRSEDRFVALDQDVLLVSPGNTLTLVLQLGPVESDLRFGSSRPRVSPDQRWIAYIENENAWLRPTATGKPVQLTTAGKKGDAHYLPIEVYFVGFTPDSKELLYSIAPGRDECPDCKHPELLRRQADYGFFLYDLASHSARKFAVPESTRVFQVMAANRLFIANVGAYGDQFGMMDLPAAGFQPLPEKCASAAVCTLAANALADCVQIGNDHSQILECDSRSGAERAVSPEGTCINEFQRPTRSPAAKHLAYLQAPERCASPDRVLWIDQKPRFHCRKAAAYGWIDDNRLLVKCEQEFVAIDIEGNRLGALPIGKPK